MLLHAASSWPLSDFSSRNAGWSLCQPTASHLKCPLCLSVFLPPLSGRKQAECPGTLLSSGVYLSVIKLSVFSFSEGHKVSPSIWVLYAQTGNLSCCGLNVSLKSPQLGTLQSLCSWCFNLGLWEVRVRGSPGAGLLPPWQQWLHEKSKGDLSQFPFLC